MDFVSVPIIVLICYMIGEIYKVLFKHRQELYKLIPIIVAFIGGMLTYVFVDWNNDEWGGWA